MASSELSFREITLQIGDRFLHARTEEYTEHALAIRIRNEWPASAKQLLPPGSIDSLSFEASAGAGQWNSAPWLAVLHLSITDTAQKGFYPVYLFEPGFQTVCLVMAQGTHRLQQAVGKKAALHELARRATILRECAVGWEKLGFDGGPFNTTRKAATGQSSDGVGDPWAASVAFGKRYWLDKSLPSDAILSKDLETMLDLYLPLVGDERLNFSNIDEDLVRLRESGELPKGHVDGAKRILHHKRFESRTRNRELIAKVKKHLGSVCQACCFEFGSVYGKSMKGFIEAHHNIPLSTVDDEGTVLQPTAEHFTVLCSNCHRAIHAAGCPGLEEFRRSLNLRPSEPRVSEPAA
jgi:5-methylcytosine-specific restriction protein A